jgi:hypothetical protein
MQARYLLRVTALVSMVALFSLAEASEKKITRAQLPPAVAKTLDEHSRGATVKGLSAETSEGKTVFEAELSVDGHATDILIDGQGNIIELEEEVAFASLPPAVKDGLTRAAGKGTLEKVESLTKKGTLVAYEAVVRDGTRTREVQVGPDGKKLAHPQ